jgi:hypothetical protein
MRGARGRGVGPTGGFRGRGFRRVGSYRYPVGWRRFRVWGWPLWGWWPGAWAMGCLLPTVGGVVVLGLALLRLVVR